MTKNHKCKKYLIMLSIKEKIMNKMIYFCVLAEVWSSPRLSITFFYTTKMVYTVYCLQGTKYVASS